MQNVFFSYRLGVCGRSQQNFSFAALWIRIVGLSDPPENACLAPVLPRWIWSFDGSDGMSISTAWSIVLFSSHLDRFYFYYNFGKCGHFLCVCFFTVTWTADELEQPPSFKSFATLIPCEKCLTVKLYIHINENILLNVRRGRTVNVEVVASH